MGHFIVESNIVFVTAPAPGLGPVNFSVSAIGPKDLYAEPATRFAID